MNDSNHITGLSNELKVANYYASLGYDIYWPLGTQSRCDFIVDKYDHLPKKIQVKTASWSKSGDAKYLQCRLISRNKYGKT